LWWTSGIPGAGVTMRSSSHGFSYSLLFAFLAITAAPGMAAAQDMPPILAPPAVAKPDPSPPLAAATVMPPAVVAAPVAPAAKPHTVAVAPPAKAAHEAKATAHHDAKFSALIRRLAAAHAHPARHHVSVASPDPVVPAPGTVVPPPGYFPPAGPYQRLVYGGPPPGVYGGWGGYRGRYPYYP
jgi:hypothetical protein